MECILTFIRGAFTQTDGQGQFAGRMDLPPHPDSIARLREKARQGQYPTADAVFSSPLARCAESARAIYPDAKIILSEKLAAFDYGVFSGKSYSDIIEDEQFGDWAQSDQLLAFPGGEAPYVFIGRCGEALRAIIAHVQQKALARVSVVTHQAVIGAILQSHSMPHCFYKNYHLSNGVGISAACNTQTASLKVLKRY